MADVDSFASSCDRIVLGGGAALAESFWSNRADSTQNIYQRYLLSVARSASDHNVPLYAVSVGGDSVAPVRRIFPGLFAFFASPQFRQATVRLQMDVEALEYFRVSATYYPDILLAIRNVFPNIGVPDAKKENYIGVQCYDMETARMLYRLSRLRRIPRCVFLHTSKATLRRMLSRGIGVENRDHYFAEDVFDTCNFLSKCAAVIGCRLHLGVVASAFQVPFYVIKQQPKVTQFFEDLNIQVPEIATSFPRSITVARSLNKQLSSATAPQLQTAGQAAIGHLDFIRSVVVGDAAVTCQEENQTWKA